MYDFFQALQSTHSLGTLADFENTKFYRRHDGKYIMKLNCSHLTQCPSGSIWSNFIDLGVQQ